MEEIEMGHKPLESIMLKLLILNPTSVKVLQLNFVILKKMILIRQTV